MSVDIPRIGRDPDAFEDFYREHVGGGVWTAGPVAPCEVINADA